MNPQYGIHLWILEKIPWRFPEERGWDGLISNSYKSPVWGEWREREGDIERGHRCNQPDIPQQPL